VGCKFVSSRLAERRREKEEALVSFRTCTSSLLFRERPGRKALWNIVSVLVGFRILTFVTSRREISFKT